MYVLANDKLPEKRLCVLGSTIYANPADVEEVQQQVGVLLPEVDSGVEYSPSDSVGEALQKWKQIIEWDGQRMKTFANAMQTLGYTLYYPYSVGHE